MIVCLGLSPALDITYGVPSLHAGGIHRPTWKLALPGGKSLNVARALRLLGAEVHALAPLGGPTGDQLTHALSAHDISLSRVTIDEDTRLCISVVDEQTTRITEIYEHSPALPEACWAEIDAAAEQIRSGWLAISGSVPEGSESTLADLASRAQERGARLAVDLRGPALTAMLERTRPDLLKLNRSEAEEAVGEAAPAELVERLLGSAHRVVVTDGAEGSIGGAEGQRWRVFPVSAGVYSVGAGDSYLAAIVHALDQGRPFSDAMRSGAGTAAANTLRPGAAVFDPDEARRLAETVRVSVTGTETEGK